MSTYAELENRVKRRLGRRGMTITTEFLDEMIAAQEQLEKSGALPRWLKANSGDEVTVAGLTILTNLPPSDFIRVYDDQALVFDDVDGNERRAIRLDTRNQLVSKRNNFQDTSVVGNTVHRDIYWFLDEDNATPQIEITPTQTRDVTFRLSYYAADTILDGLNTNNWCAFEPELISGMAGFQLACWLRDDRAKQLFDVQWQTARRRMVNQIESDEWGDTDLVMGDPD